MIVNLLRALLGAAIDGIQRFPVTAVALVVTAIIANLDIADGLELHWTKQQQVYQTLAAFIIMSLVKQIALESRGYNRSLQHLAALAAGAIAAVTGRPWSDESKAAALAALADDLDPMANLLGSAAMKLHLQRVLTGRALDCVMQRARAV